MTTDVRRYTSGRIAMANLSASIAGLELRRAERATFENSREMSNLLFVRGDVLDRIEDHNRAEMVATEAIASSPDTARVLYLGARLAERFHRFREANGFIDRALAAGHPVDEIDAERATLLQATGAYHEALMLRERLANVHPGMHNLAPLASLLAEMHEWQAAESCYVAALEADVGVSPIPCAQVLFEWGVSAKRRGELERAEEVFAELGAILPEHVPGRRQRAEVAQALRQVRGAE